MRNESSVITASGPLQTLKADPIDYRIEGNRAEQWPVATAAP